MSIINIPITINSDEKGYFDRECPNEECLFVFKINTEDWEEKVSDEEVHCPKCGHVDTSEKWWTQSQIDGIRKLASDWAFAHIEGALNKSFKELENSTRRNKFVKVTYKPGRKATFINNPIGTSAEWEQDVSCSNCQTRYSVIGTAYFCPCCGYNMIREAFFESLDNINNMIDSLPEMGILLENTYGKDKSTSICETMLEGSLSDIISAFQKFAEQKYISLSSKSARVNDFQIVEKGSRLFDEIVQKPYSIWLSNDELFNMNMMFQRRHLIEHNGGIIDETYIKKSNDHSYKVGQRLVVKSTDAQKLIEIIRKLCVGLEGLAL